MAAAPTATLEIQLGGDRLGHRGPQHRLDGLDAVAHDVVRVLERGKQLSATDHVASSIAPLQLITSIKG